jgi:hypothetical protein
MNWILLIVSFILVMLSLVTYKDQLEKKKSKPPDIQSYGYFYYDNNFGSDDIRSWGIIIISAMCAVIAFFQGIGLLE